MLTNDRYTSRSLSAEVHTPTAVTPLPRPGAGMPPPGDKPFRKTASLHAHIPVRLKTGMICLAVAAGLCAVLIPLWQRADLGSGGGLDGGLGGILGGGLLQGGLPPVGGTAWETDTGGSASADSNAEDSGEEITPAEPEDTLPQEPPEGQRPPENGDASTDGAATEGVSDISPDTGAASDSDNVPGGVTEDPPSTEKEPSAETRPSGGEHGEDTGGDATEATESAPDTAPEPETGGVPEGCYPFAAVDMSLSDYGAGYIEGDTTRLPAVLPDGRLWDAEGVPAVLIVHTHPYEGYSDGGDWYSPDGGGLALTDTPNAPDGVVALGAELTRALRGAGITVMHLRIAVSAEDTAADIYDRTRTVISYYCRAYPDIGLVLDLRRSAELTGEGEILRTAGRYGGDVCAQLRISVGGSGDSLAGDLAAALALRARLWAEEPTLSRPVRVKEGERITDAGAPRVLTLELGSAGNTYDEALRLVAPLASGLEGMLVDGE